MVASSQLRLIACMSVVAGGEHRAWCMWRACSPADKVVSMLTAMTVGSKLAWLLFADAGGAGRRGIIHNPVRVHLLPQRITLPQYMIVHPILVKMTSQPASHRVTMEMREWEARLGMIWACCTEAERAENIESAHVHGVYALAIREPGNDGFAGWAHVGHGGSSCERVTCCARV
jgi:hypothetical protein